MLLGQPELVGLVVLAGLPLAVSSGVLAGVEVAQLDLVLFGYLLLAVGGSNGVSGVVVPE